MEVMMKPSEKALFERCLRAAKTYFEFGAGGSTLFASKIPTLERVWSVDNHPDWVEKVRGQVDPARFQLFYADIGPVREFGQPRNLVAQAHLFHRYWQPLLELPEQPELILVDGRFRVQCCLQALLKAPAATLCFHDFTIRPEYHVVLPFVDVVETVETLVVLKRKEGVQDDAIRQVAQNYVAVPS
jgi:protein O-GlcNAc transferase